MNQSTETAQVHRIDIEAEWDNFCHTKALVDEDGATEFLAVLYAWRDEAVTDALRGVRSRSGPLFFYSQEDAENILNRPLMPGEADRLVRPLTAALTDAAWSAVVSHETREGDGA